MEQRPPLFEVRPAHGVAAAAARRGRPSTHSSARARSASTAWRTAAVFPDPTRRTQRRAAASSSTSMPPALRRPRPRLKSGCAPISVRCAAAAVLLAARCSLFALCTATRAHNSAAGPRPPLAALPQSRLGRRCAWRGRLKCDPCRRAPPSTAAPTRTARRRLTTPPHPPTPPAASLGGAVLGGPDFDVTHVVVRHKQQPLLRQLAAGVAVVAAEYVTAATEPGLAQRPDPVSIHSGYLFHAVLFFHTSTPIMQRPDPVRRQ